MSKEKGEETIRHNHTSSRFSSHSKIGRRATQEDRFDACPSVLGNDDLQFYGVFDGTVGDYASQYAQNSFFPHLVDGLEKDPSKESMEKAMRNAYRKTDESFLEIAKRNGYHYAASTSVTVLLHKNLLTVGHLADSKAALGWVGGEGEFVGKFLTKDHKPDMYEELARIEASGGRLVYLRGRPFLQGGDFKERVLRGEKPMQLNYSRAFGGKDLKPFGLSSEPDINHFEIEEKHRYLVLASDGVWDVMDASFAMMLVFAALQKGVDPAEYLVDEALSLQNAIGKIDNATAIVVHL